MEDLFRWLPTVLCIGTAIATIATVRAQAGFSAWRQDQHQQRLDAHERRIATTEIKVALLERPQE